MAHANFSHWNVLALQVFNPACCLRTLLPCRRVAASRQHAVSAPLCPHWRLLLPLRRIESARRLRENVRVQEIRVPLVGNTLRKTPHAYACTRLPRRPAIPPPWSHRTRPPVVGTQLLLACTFDQVTNSVCRRPLLVVPLPASLHNRKVSPTLRPRKVPHESHPPRCCSVCIVRIGSARFGLAQLG